VAGTNAFDRLDQTYRLALLQSIDLVVDEAFDDVARLLNGGKWDDLLFLSDALPDRPMYVERYTPLFAKQFLVCLLTVAGKTHVRRRNRPRVGRRRDGALRADPERRG
jgi:hypothetical protein